MTPLVSIGRPAMLAAVLAMTLAQISPRAAQAPATAEVTFRIVVVSSADRAERVLERLKTGGDFIAVAIAESLDPSARQGGLVGPVSLATLRPELQEALRPLAP